MDTAAPYLRLPGGSSTYKYQPLPEDQKSIRLLKVEKQQDSIILNLVTCVFDKLSDIPTYHAISYTWGDPARSYGLVLRGGLVPITRSVFDMLPVLLSYGGPNYLWIDSICINQDDVHEKCAQIPFMQTIYFEAELVVAYIGDAPDAQLVPPFLMRLNEKLSENQQTIDQGGSLGISAPYFSSKNATIERRSRSS